MNIEAKKIPTEPGCLVQRILVPTNNFEARCLAEDRPVWRVTLWICGMMRVATMTNPQPPSLTDAMLSFNSAPFAWEPVKLN